MAGRFIKLYDKLLKWEWYQYPNTLCLFIYLLLKANYKDTNLRGVLVQRGQLVTSLPKIATDTGLSIQQTRTSLSHLISTGEVTDESTNQGRLITVVKYDEYQSSTDGSTGNQQATNRRINRQSTDEATPCIEYIEENRRYRNTDSPTEREGRTAQRFSPPSRDEIEIFCLENGLVIDVDRFLDYYTSNGWMVGKSHMKDWQATVRNWSRRDQQQVQQKPEPTRRFDRPAKQVVAQQYKQRAYDDVQAELIAEQDREMEEWLRNGGGA